MFLIDMWEGDFPLIEPHRILQFCLCFSLLAHHGHVFLSFQIKWEDQSKCVLNDWSKYGSKNELRQW